MKKIILILLLSTPTWSLLAKDQKLNDLLDHIDRLYRSNTSHTKLEMTIVTPHWQRTLKLEAWTKGLEHTFVTVLAPRKDKGISTLKRGGEMWNYFPKINKVIRVPPSMMMGSWMGSDFTNDDLVKENTRREDYSSVFGPGTKKLYQIILKPHSTTVTVWGRIELWVDRSTRLPVREEFFNENGTKMRIISFKEVKKLGGRTIPVVLELLPLNKPGQKTVVKYVTANFDQSISSQIFTRKNLQRRR